MTSYPSFMPTPLVTYGVSNQTTTITTTFESGRTSQRARSTKQKDVAKAVFNFDFLQYGIWEGFVANVINNGAMEFLIKLPNPATQVVEDRTVLIAGGLYDAQAIAGAEKWAVSCTLIIQDKVSISSGVISYLSLFNGNADDAIAFSDFFHYVVTEVLPENLEP